MTIEIDYGDGPAKYGPGVQIEMDGEELAKAVDLWLHAQGFIVRGPRTITVNGELCESASCYVYPSGFVVFDGEKYAGSGPEKENEQ